MNDQYGAWKNAEQFLKGQAGVSGLPKKTINVDTDKQPSKVTQTGGMLYEAEARDELVAKEPALKCPSCGQVAYDVAAAVNPYTRTLKDTSGKSYQGSVPKWPLASKEPPTQFYCIEPCGCRVDHIWAGFFQLEVNSRLEGGTPRPVTQVGPKALAHRLKLLEDDLAKLYSLSSHKLPPEEREAVDYWIVIVADLIQRTCPGPHNMKPMDKALTPKVTAWAQEKGMAVPPVAPPTTKKPGIDWPSIMGGTPIDYLANPAAPKEGQPVYRMPDGTVSTTPTHPAQEPCGVVAGAYNKKTGEIPVAKSPPKIVGTWGPLTQEEKDQQDATLLAMAAAGLLKPPLPAPIGIPTSDAMEVPEITETKSGQFGVRFGDIYRVFVDEQDAINFKYELINGKKLKAPAAGPKKPTLQTLPVEEKPIDIFGTGTGGDGKNAYGEPQGVFANAAKAVTDHNKMLLDILKATRPQDMPKEFLKRILDYTYSNQGIALSVIESTFAQALMWNGGTATDMLKTIRESIGNYLDGYNRMSADATKFVKGFVDLVEIPPPPVPGAKVASEVKPSPTPPPGPPPAPVKTPPAVTDKTARKKRSIRNIQD
jgi:hypothetical protein